MVGLGVSLNPLPRVLRSRVRKEKICGNGDGSAGKALVTKPDKVSPIAGPPGRGRGQPPAEYPVRRHALFKHSIKKIRKVSKILQPYSEPLQAEQVGKVGGLVSVVAHHL